MMSITTPFNSLKMLKIFILVFLSIVSSVRCSERGYDSSTIQFSPKGRIQQVDYAIEASKKGDPIIAVRCDDGIVIVTASDMSHLRVTNNALCVNPPLKVHYVDKHISIIITGLLFDGLAIIDAAKSIASSYRSKFNEEIPIEYFSEQLSQLFHRQTVQGGSRPLGISLLVTGVDKIFGSQIFSIDPDGSCYSWRAVSLGKQSDKINDILAREVRDNWNVVDTNKSNEIPLNDYNTNIPINQILRRIKENVINNYLKSNETVFSENSIEWNIQIITGKLYSNREGVEWIKHSVDDNFD